MAPSRVLRLGVAALLSVVLSAGLTPVASAADPTDPMSGSTGSAPVAATRMNGSTPQKARAAHLTASGAAAPAVASPAISGTVTQKGGGAIAGAFIWAGSTTSSTYYTTVAAANGTYSLPVNADSYYVWFDDANSTHFNGYYSGGGVPVNEAHAVVVTVTTGTVSGINAQLQVEAPWSVSIEASPTSAAAGSTSRVTARTNQDVELTDFSILLYRSDGTSWYCIKGVACYVDDTLASPGSWTYHATVAVNAPSGAVQATSPELAVNWVVPTTYHALPPTRLLDTRDGTGGLSGPFTNHVARSFQVTGGTSLVPAGVTAVTGNLTVTGQTSKGYLFIGPDPMNNPTSSTVNFPLGDDRANGVTVALSATGSLSVTFVAPTNGPSGHAIFDVTGYFVPSGS